LAIERVCEVLHINAKDIGELGQDGVTVNAPLVALDLRQP
jgi:hypothetical protein